jgi:hypothetical protein
MEESTPAMSTADTAIVSATYASSQPSRRIRIHSNAKFTDEETQALLDAMRMIIPIGREEWEQVVTEFNHYFPLSRRGLENLRRKFNTMANKKIPTGDPNIPDHVKEAKEINSLIFSKSEAVVLGKRRLESEDYSLDDNNIETSNTNGIIDKTSKTNDDSVASNVSNRKRIGQFKHRKSEVSELVEYMVVNDLATRRSEEKKWKLQERSERRREKKEEKRNRREEKRHHDMMMMMMVMMSGAKKKDKEKIKKGMMDVDSLSSSSSSDYSEDDGDRVEVVERYCSNTK